MRCEACGGSGIASCCDGAVGGPGEAVNGVPPVPIEIGQARRRRLANRRPAVTATIAFARPDGNLSAYDATVGFDELGRPREIFLFGARDGSEMAAALADTAVALSVALQHGVKAEAMALSVSRLPDGSGDALPASAVGAALDLLARYERERDGLAREYAAAELAPEPGA